MNVKSLLLSSALAVGVAGAAFGQSSTAPAQQDPASPTTQSPSTQSPSTQQQPGEMSPTSSTSEGHSFTGSIVKTSGKYMLHSAGADYRLDDQKQAKQFDGKQVKVTGDLDQSTNTIKVQSIEPSSSM